MASLIDAIKTICLEQGFDKTYWVGYSGGLDSHVLLHACAMLRKQYPLRLKAVYVNHGLSPNASQWGKHCEKVCAALAIDFIQQSVHAKASLGESPEEKARDLRYAAFADLLALNDILLTAHQEDDQAETFLVQLLRGAGPKGLSAMPLMKSFAAGIHARPFLSISRTTLKNYAKDHQLSWIDDESNEDKSFTRNFLRHSLLPILKQRWPTVTKTLARVAGHCADAEVFIHEVAIEDLAGCRGIKDCTLSVEKLLRLNPSRQRQVIRVWFSEQGFSAPSSVKLAHIQTDFLQSASDKLPLMRFDQIELRRYRDELYLMPALAPHDPTLEYSWDLTQPLSLPNLGTLSAEKIGISSDIEQVTVRFRRGGERCYFPERQCHQELKSLMQQWGIPPWLRDRIPLLYSRDRLIAVVGYYLAKEQQSEVVPD